MELCVSGAWSQNRSLNSGERCVSISSLAMSCGLPSALVRRRCTGRRRFGRLPARPQGAPSRHVLTCRRARSCLQSRSE
eukprot:3216361-Pleurochrysis_carterae.AAC.1